MGERRPVADPARYVLGHLPEGLAADLRLEHQAWTTIRFADGRIHQPASEASRRLSLRVEDGGRLGVATTTDLSPESLDRLASTARALARAAPPEPKFPGFPGAGPGARPTPYSIRTATTSPEEACRAARSAIDAALALAPDARVTGALNVGAAGLAVATSTGLVRSSRRSAAQLSVLVEGRDEANPASGWSEGAHWDLGRLGAARIGQEAADRMPRAAPRPVAAGTYRVLLRGPAVAEALGFLAQLGFGGVAELERSSCLLRHRGERLFPTFLSLVDDPRSSLGLPTAIDHEGVLTHATPLIDRGRVAPAVTDLLYGGRLGRPSSGHGLPPESPWGEVGPVPEHLLLEGGTSSEEELLREVRRGIVVTRFHYVRTVDPGTGTITGMTRDGTYLVEDGELGAPVRNLRFTQSVVDALRRTIAVGRARRAYGSERGTACVTAPALAVDAFRFTSATVF